MNFSKQSLKLMIIFAAISPTAFGADSPTVIPNLEKGYADLVKKVGPGVVSISTFARPKMQSAGPMMYNDEMFRRFFEDFFEGRPGGPPGGGQNNGPRRGFPGQSEDGKGKPVPLALGTGFIIDATEGLILTNYHVIQGSEEIKIQYTEENEELDSAEIIGRDPELDVALLKIKQKRKWTAITLGDSDKADVGEYVIAIGNPLGYGHTVSHGILSAKGRKNPEFRLGRYLQTDASINPGNSGGPLVSMKGEVIGINNAIDARAQGIGFAIPINLVKAILPELRSKGSVTRGFLGVSAAELNPEIAEELKINESIRGALIADVGKGTPADRGGLKPYDVVTSVNGEKISDPQDLTLKISSIPVGKVAALKVIRAGKEKIVEVTVGERPGLKALSPQKKNKESVGIVGALGFAVEEVKSDAEPVVVVTEIEPGSIAAQRGLNKGDVILDVARKPVQTVAQLEQILKAEKGKTVSLRVRRFNSQGGDFVTIVILALPK